MDYLSLCLTCKDENDYLPEWLDYHILMGVDRFFIYDNGSDTSLRESLRNYVERGWVVVIDIPGKAMQVHAYEHCLQTFGKQSRWIGFIDTDEFLVPKTTLDLKEFLKGYEAYGGLAISSLFFGSNGHLTRPSIGQIAAYTRRTHETFQGNVLIKSIVQPEHVLMPVSPHDFAYKENYWCVNEDFLLVDGMKFSCHTEKIQLNHYFCRSQSDIDQKLARGWADYATGAWPRERFDVVNKQAVYLDTTILQNLVMVFDQVGIVMDGLQKDPIQVDLPGVMAGLVARRNSTPITFVPPRQAKTQARIAQAAELKAQTLSAEQCKDYAGAIRLIDLRLQMMPNKLSLLVEISVVYLRLGDPSASWRALSQAWKLAPKSYTVLLGMAYFFLQVQDFAMAEKTCRLLLDMAPDNLMILGYLVEALMGQGRSEEATKVGLTVVDLDDLLGELPEGMVLHLTKLMADHFCEKGDYGSALCLWEARIELKPEDVNVVLELSRVLMRKGDKLSARQKLIQALKISPNNLEAIELLGSG